MRTRRDVMAAGAALAVVPGIARAAERPVSLVLFDSGQPASRAFAAALARQGAEAIPLGPDTGRLWFERLAGRAVTPGFAMAGLTRHSDLFILQGLAAETGAHLRFEGKHDGRGGSLVHELTSHAPVEACAQDLAAARTRWAPQLATGLGGFPAAPPLTSRAVTVTAEGGRAASPSVLFSWVIA